jgi:hypothetical protein
MVQPKSLKKIMDDILKPEKKEIVESTMGSGASEFDL